LAEQLGQIVIISSADARRAHNTTSACTAFKQVQSDSHFEVRQSKSMRLTVVSREMTRRASLQRLSSAPHVYLARLTILSNLQANTARFEHTNANRRAENAETRPICTNGIEIAKSRSIGDVCNQKYVTLHHERCI